MLPCPPSSSSRTVFRHALCLSFDAFRVSCLALPFIAYSFARPFSFFHPPSTGIHSSSRVPPPPSPRSSCIPTLVLVSCSPALPPHIQARHPYKHADRLERNSRDVDAYVAFSFSSRYLMHHYLYSTEYRVFGCAGRRYLSEQSPLHPPPHSHLQPTGVISGIFNYAPSHRIGSTPPPPLHCICPMPFSLPITRWYCMYSLEMRSREEPMSGVWRGQFTSGQQHDPSAHVICDPLLLAIYSSFLDSTTALHPAGRQGGGRGGWQSNNSWAPNAAYIQRSQVVSDIRWRRRMIQIYLQRRPDRRFSCDLTPSNPTPCGRSSSPPPPDN